MTQMKEWGSHLFTGKVWVRDGTPFIHFAPTWEIEEPFRFCGRTLHVKLNKNTAFVVGIWRLTGKSVSIHLLESLRGKTIEDSVEVSGKPENERNTENRGYVEHSGVQEGNA